MIRFLTHDLVRKEPGPFDKWLWAVRNFGPEKRSWQGRRAARFPRRSGAEPYQLKVRGPTQFVSPAGHGRGQRGALSLPKRGQRSALSLPKRGQRSTLVP